jgi:hypothetical protein
MVDGQFSTIGFGRWFVGLSENGTVAGSDDVFEHLSVGGDFACGLRSDGQLRCFGSRVR